MATLQRFSARLIAETNVNVAVTGVGVSIDGVSVADLDEVLLNGQTTQAENGLWVAHTGSAWTRQTDFDTAGEMLKGTEFYIREGNSNNAGSSWTFNTGGTITVGTTALSFKRESYGPGAAPTGVGLDRDPVTNQWALQNQFTPTGYYSRVQLDTYGRVLDGVVSETATTFREGLKLVWDSSTAFTVEAGGAYIPAEGDVITLESDTTVSGPALTANTWYYVYLYESGGTGTVETVTQAPETIAYLGDARIKGPDGTPDDTRRFNGTLRAGSSVNTIRNFERHGSWIYWQEDITASPYQVLTNGLQGASYSSAISCSAVVPPHVRVVLVRFNETGGNSSEISNNGTSAILTVPGNDGYVAPFVLNSSQQFYYRHPAGVPANGLSVGIVGYFEPLA